MKRLDRVSSKNGGFSLIELAVALFIIGLLASGGLVLIRAVVGVGQRAETSAYMERVRQALLYSASVNGKLPSPDTSGSYATIPHVALVVEAHDAWGRPLRYDVNAMLLIDKATSCNYLKNSIDKTYVGAESIASPVVWDEDAGGTVVAPVVIVSAGAGDADHFNDEFDAIAGKGSNNDGTPFLRHPPQAGFDDMVSYIGGTTLYDWLECP